LRLKEAASLRMVASEAGTGIGLVQRHFGSKLGLIKAVDDRVLAVIAAAIAHPLPGPPGDPVVELGQRVTSLIGQHLTWSTILGEHSSTGPRSDRSSSTVLWRPAKHGGTSRGPSSSWWSESTSTTRGRRSIH
jgi:AcrR family transcriptional regulator